MHELWSSASYEPHLLSLPFALAPAAMLIAIAYAAVMRGAPTLRGFLLAHGGALLPYAIVMMLAPSIASPALAARLFRIAAAFVPMAGATGLGFQLALLGAYRRRRVVVWLAIASAAVWIPVGIATGAAVDGVRRLPGLWFAHAGPAAWLALLHTAVVAAPGFAALGHAVLTRPPSDERRQLRAALIAGGVIASGLVDAALAYGVGRVPLGWLLSGIGSLLLVRALIVEDLLRVRAVDTAAPLLVVYFAAGALLAWGALAELDAPLPWPLTALALVMCFAAVRVSVATVGLVSGGARGREGPLDRLLAQLVSRTRAISRSGPAGAPRVQAQAEIAQLAIDIIELGIGVRTTLLLASQSDWGWTTHTGERLDDTRAPDPLLASWLAERRDAVLAGDHDDIPPDLRELLDALLAVHHARALVPVGSADELLAVLLIPSGARRARAPTLGFLLRAAERLAEALLHARLAQRAAERAALAREVELAATVQSELLPGRGPHAVGAVTVVGSWQPATSCAGDFWTVMPLGPAGSEVPVLIAIGDVTGHGVASAMVTAAAIGACELCVRRDGPALDLVTLVAALDAAVRRVGGGQLAMTCAAAILDPAAREIRFTSNGHPAAYLCRARTPERASPVDLHALVGRGNPVGTGAPLATRVQRRPLDSGDLVVWYTDGVVEAQDPAGTPFGDRRLQHLLKKLDSDRLTPTAVHDLVQRSVAAHRAGRPRADDETLVVARLASVREVSP